nr:hypothetical protein [Tanacetum cinerariifolium]
TSPNENGDEPVSNESRPIMYVNVVHTKPTFRKNEGEKVGNDYVNEIPSYATKLSPTSSTKADLRKLEVNVPNDAFKKVTMVKGFFFFKFSSTKGVDFMLCDGLWMIPGVPIFLNKWSPSVRGKHRGLMMKVLIEVKKKKPGENNGGTKNFKPVLVKPKTQYRAKAKQSFERTSNSLKPTPFVGANKASTPAYNKESPTNTSGFFSSISNSFEALNVDILITKEVATGSKATTLAMHGEGQSSTPMVEKIDVLEKQILEGKLVLVDDDEKPLKKVDYQLIRIVMKRLNLLKMKLQIFWHQKELDMVRKVCGNN